MIVELEDFNTYSGNYEESEGEKNLKRLFLKSAEEIVEGYLGYEVGERYKEGEIPSVIKLSIMRIATLMLEETGGNIGLTGRSFGDSSRTFINYSNYKKYLEPLDSIRDVRF